MNTISRRSMVRSASAVFALPFAGALLPAYASTLGEPEGTSQTNKLRLTRTAATAVSLDLVDFVKDHSAKAIATRHQGRAGDYSALGDQFHMLGKHLSLAGADKVVKAHCRKLLKTGAVPTLDPQAVAHAVSCIRAYAPSYSAQDLLVASGFPSTAQEWAVHLKRLRKNGAVKYFHQAGRQLNAMGVAAKAGAAGSYHESAYHPTDTTDTAHIVDICSLSQKQKFWACLAVTAAIGLLVIAAIAVACGATGIVACIGAAFPSASVGFAVSGAALALISGALIAACAAYLASYAKKSGATVVFSAI